MGVAQHSCMRFLMNHPVSLKGSCHRFPIPACIYLPAEPLSKVFQCVLIYVYAVILDSRCYEIGKSRLCKLSVVILKFFPYRFICKRRYFFAKRIKVAHYVADICKASHPSLKHVFISFSPSCIAILFLISSSAFIPATATAFAVIGATTGISSGLSAAVTAAAPPLAPITPPSCSPVLGCCSLAMILNSAFYTPGGHLSSLTASPCEYSPELIWLKARHLLPFPVALLLHCGLRMQACGIFVCLWLHHHVQTAAL